MTPFLENKKKLVAQHNSVKRWEGGPVIVVDGSRVRRSPHVKCNVTVWGRGVYGFDLFFHYHTLTVQDSRGVREGGNSVQSQPAPSRGLVTIHLGSPPPSLQAWLLFVSVSEIVEAGIANRPSLHSPGEPMGVWWPYPVNDTSSASSLLKYFKPSHDFSPAWIDKTQTQSCHALLGI